VPKRAASASAERSIAKSLREYARGIAGGLMFSLPLLYTMEMWWAGFTSQPERLLLYIAATFALLIGCFSLLFAANVAPTDEIVLVAHSISAWRLIGLALLSIALSGLILFYSEFRGSKRFAAKAGTMHIVSMTAVSYVIALLASLTILWFFGRLDGEPIITVVGQTVVVGVAAALGASAGRLLLQ
jgi:uncharacterized membrane protein